MRWLHPLMRAQHIMRHCIACYVMLCLFHQDGRKRRRQTPESRKQYQPSEGIAPVIPDPSSGLEGYGEGSGLEVSFLY